MLSTGAQHLSTCHPMGMEIEPVNFEDLGLILKWLSRPLKIIHSDS
jgi:hypothetical protein